MQLPAAVSPLTRDLVLGGPRPGRVVAAFPTALYVRLEGVSGLGAVLPLVTADALLLPTAARLGLSSVDVRWPVAVGDDLVVGDGRIRGRGLDLEAVREWRPSRTVAGVGVPFRAVAGWLPRDGVLTDLCADLTAAALAGGPVEDRVLGLIGAGAGLTPSGDDALCGVLLGLRVWAGAGAAAGSALTRVGDAVRRARHRTTDLSASLLAAAAEGYAVPQVVDLVHHLAAADQDAATASLEPSLEPSLEASLEAVLAIGHSSGRDLVAGLAGALHSIESALLPIDSALPGTPAPSGRNDRGRPR